MKCNATWFSECHFSLQRDVLYCIVIVSGILYIDLSVTITVIDG